MKKRFFSIRIRPLLAPIPRCLFALFATALLALSSLGAPLEHQGMQFIGLDSLKNFYQRPGARQGETVYLSKEIVSEMDWDELVLSWNVESSGATYLKVEARAIYLQGPTKFYAMGDWSSDATVYPRTSIKNQKDNQGDVSTDTLILKQPTRRLQLRLTLGGEPGAKPSIKFLAISLTDTKSAPTPRPPNRRAWGKLVDVPERSQMAYPNGNVLCSPTTVSMLLEWWAQQGHRPDLDKDVPEIAQSVYDTAWKGTGNWSFNMAYPGRFRNMRAYVTRMSDLTDLEDWIARGIPVGLSLCYDRLRAKGPGPNGHLVVCVGFTPEGDPIINDPGTSKNVRKIFPRKNLVNAWSQSNHAAYLVYPLGTDIPDDPFGHWDSWTARTHFEWREPWRPEPEDRSRF